MRMEGLYVPLLTPMTAGGALDLQAMPGHVERLIRAGVDGLVALGTTGEFADLAAGERARVAAAAVDAAAGRVPVLVGAGGIGATETCEHVRDAAAAGADGVLALPPLYWKLGDDGLVAHFAQVAAATDLPVVLYDFPALAGTALTPAVVQRIATEVGQVAGIKLSGPELRVAHGVIARVKPSRPEFAVMIGAPDLILPGLLAGADGTIAAIANVAPELVGALVAAARGGDLASARRHHRKLLALLAVPALCAPSVLALKAAAAACGAPLEPVVRTPPAGGEDALRRAPALVADVLRD